MALAVMAIMVAIGIGFIYVGAVGDFEPLAAIGLMFVLVASTIIV
jgi:hypothetical protein